eukprot:jgi/Picsp_1/1247/NSC_04728-R1_peter pan-like protein
MAKTRRRKKRTHVVETEDPGRKGQPKSFVLRRGRHAALLKDLEKDMRKVMAPNTASNLRESKRNVLKDFVHVAGPLGVTHFLMLSATQNASYLRIAKSPRGPTLTFRIHEYALMRDVMSSLQRPRCPQSVWTSHPLVVMNAFNQEGSKTNRSDHLKLVTVMLQNLFPAIDVAKTSLSSCQRVLLFEHNGEADRVSLRHYSIAIKAAGVAKNLKKLLNRKREMPDLGKMKDISEFMTKSGYGSESEGEDAEAGRVEVADTNSRGEVRGTKQSRVRLTEIGPRMELELIKIEEGLCDGKVLYHKFESRSQEQVAAKDSEMEQKRKLKEKRKREQAENVRKKELAKRIKEEAKKMKKEEKTRKKMTGSREIGAGKRQSPEQNFIMKKEKKSKLH